VTSLAVENESAQITDFAWKLMKKRIDEMADANEFVTWKYQPTSEEEKLSGWVDSSVESRYAIDIKARTCTCQQRKVHTFACKHLLKALHGLNLLENHEYLVDPRYTKKMYVQCLEDAKASAGMQIKGMKTITKCGLSDGELIAPASEPVQRQKQKQKKRKVEEISTHDAED